MEYPSPATPRTPYTNSQVPSQYTPCVDAYSQDFDDSRVHGSNTHHNTNNTSLVNVRSQLDQGHNAVYNPYLNMPSFGINAQGIDTHLMNPNQQPNNGHSAQFGSLSDTDLVGPGTDDQTSLVANLGQQANGDHNVGYMFPHNTSQRSNPGLISLPRFLPNTSLQSDHVHDARYENIPTRPSAELGTYDSNISMTNASPQPNHNFHASRNASPTPNQQYNHGYRAIQDRSFNTSQQSNYVVRTDHPIAIYRSNTGYDALHSTPPNTSQRIYYEHNGLHSSTLNTPVSGQPTSWKYEKGCWLVSNAPLSDIPIDPALTALPIPIDEPLSHQAHPGFVPAMLQPASNARSRLQRAPLYIGGRVFSLAEQRIIILSRHLLGYTAEHIAPVFGLQDDGSGEPAKSAEVIEAAYEFLKDGQKYQGSTGLWAEADDMVSARLDVKIRAARQKQIRVQVERIKCELVAHGHCLWDIDDANCCREAISLKETRHNLASMDDEMEKEQAFFMCQSQKIQSCHVQDS